MSKRTRDPDHFVNAKKAEQSAEKLVTKKSKTTAVKRQTNIFVLPCEDGKKIRDTDLFNTAAILLHKVLYEGKLKDKHQMFLNNALEAWEKEKIKNPCYLPAIVQKEVADYDRRSHNVRLEVLKNVFQNDILKDLENMDEIHLINASQFHLENDRLIKYGMRIEHLLPPSFPTHYSDGVIYKSETPALELNNYHYKNMVKKWEDEVAEWKKINSKEFRQTHITDWGKLSVSKLLNQQVTPNTYIRFAVCCTEAGRLQRLSSK